MAPLTVLDPTRGTEVCFQSSMTAHVEDGLRVH